MASCVPDYEVSIPLTQEPRFNARPPLLSPKEQLAFNKWFREELANKWIRPSKARHSCSMLWVPKSDGSLRACVNYVPLNPLVKSMVYAPPMQKSRSTELGEVVGSRRNSALASSIEILIRYIRRH
jgi:hypothetical protein